MKMRRWMALALAFAMATAACSQRTPQELADHYPTDLANIVGDGDSGGSGGEPDGDTGGSVDTGPRAPVAPDPDPTPLGLDTDLRLGTLDNGLTYYLRDNDAPGGALDLRLVVNAGSAQQLVPDSGGAHFLEHMMFNGTTSFPGNELDRALQRLGIRFGPDLNAFTSYDETVYILSATTGDRDAVTTAFDVIAEWASSATIDPAEVVAERGVVRDELRQRRESVEGIIFDEFESIYTQGTPYAGYEVVGDAGKVESTEAAALRDFYERWYRPSNMAVVVVGDMSVGDMEGLLIDRFAAFAPRGGEHPERSDIEITPSSEPFASVVTHPDNVVDNLSIDIPATVWDTGTVGGAQLVVWETLIAEMITNRLTDAWFAGELEVDQEPSLGEFAINRGLRYFGSNLQGPDLGTSLEQYLGLLRGATDGFTGAELAAALASYRAGLDAREDSLGSIQDWEYATIYTNHFLAGTSAEAPADAIDRERRILDAVEAGRLADHWAWMLETGGPIVVAIGADEATLPTADAMLEIAASTVGTERADAGQSIDRLMDRPDTVDPVRTDSRSNSEATVTTWEFANGATVVFLPTRISEGSVTMLAEGLGGYSGLDDGSAALVGLATDAVSQSGVAEITPSQLDRFLADKSISLSPFIASETEGFSGSSTGADIEILFQLLHLLTTAPRIDDTGFASALADGEILQQSVDSDPATAASLALNALIYQGDFHSWIPSDAQLESATPASLLDVYNSRLATVDDLIVSIVGDIDPGVVEDVARRYIGTLPGGADDTYVDTRPSLDDRIEARDITLPEGTANGGIELLWSSEQQWTDATAATAVVLETIINTRIIETVREELGASYGGFASISLTTVPDSRIDGYIAIDGDPSRLNEIRSTILRELADLAGEGPTNDEFDRAVSVIASDYDFVDNGLFITENLELERNPGTDIITTAGRSRLLSEVTSSDVEALATVVFNPDSYLEVTRTGG